MYESRVRYFQMNKFKKEEVKKLAQKYSAKFREANSYIKCDNAENTHNPVKWRL